MIINTDIRTKQQKSKNLRSYLDFRVNKIVFLVRNAVNPSAHSFFYTQYLLPDVKPYFVFWRGMNMTRFLTGQQHLTLFTYEVLTILSSEWGWTFRDIRSYFNINFKSKRLKNLSLASRKLQAKVPVASQRISFQSAGIENTSDSDHRVLPEDPGNRKRKSDDTVVHGVNKSIKSLGSDGRVLPSLKRRQRTPSPSDVPLSRRLCVAQVGGSDNSQPEIDHNISIVSGASDLNGGQIDLRTARLFSKFQNFSAALKLVALNIEPCLRFPQTRFELYYGLMVEGFDSDVLLRFKTYLREKFPPLLTAEGLHQVVNEYIRFGGISKAERTVYYTKDIEYVRKSEPNWFSRIVY